MYLGINRLVFRVEPGATVCGICTPVFITCNQEVSVRVIQSIVISEKLINHKPNQKTISENSGTSGNRP